MLVRAGALGDVILTLPAIRALRVRYPGTRIEVAGYPDLWEVAGPLVDRRISVERPAFAGLLTGQASPELLAWLRAGRETTDVSRPVDLAIAWTRTDPRPLFQAAGIEHIVHASPFPPAGSHVSAWYLHTLGLPFPAHDESLLRLSEEERQAGRQTLWTWELDRPIILHPGAGAVWKRWPAERFGALARALCQGGHDVALLEGPADAEAVAATLEYSGPLPVIRSTSIRRLAIILSEARVFVGNDSGATHLAAAAGTPTIAIFGPTDPTSWAPLGSVRVLRACSARATKQDQIRVCEDPGCMAEMGIEAVLTAVRHEMAL